MPTWQPIGARTASIDPAVAEVLQSENAPESHLLNTHLLNAIAVQPQALILMLEGYHIITNLTRLEGPAFLVDHAPPGLHLVITSGADPELPLFRWRVSGQLSEIRVADLRFTQEETAVLFLQMGLSLTKQQSDSMEKHAEGWVAGLQSADMSLQSQADPEQFIFAQKLFLAS